MYFSNPSMFREFVAKEDICQAWKIHRGYMNARGKSIEGKNYTEYFRNLFSEKGFFRRKVSVAEIVSWLDNISLMIRILNELELYVSPDVFKEITIMLEYRIHLSKNMRVDFVLRYGDNIVLLEQRTVSDFEKIRATWQKKISECLVYKELMSYYMPNYHIVLYAMIMMYEYDNNKPVQKNIDYNNNQVNYFVEYLLSYFFIDKSVIKSQ